MPKEKKEKKHACPHPPGAAAFATASDLTKHVRAVHEKRRDYPCPHCEGVAFGEASKQSSAPRTTLQPNASFYTRCRPSKWCVVAASAQICAPRARAHRPPLLAL